MVGWQVVASLERENRVLKEALRNQAGEHATAVHKLQACCQLYEEEIEELRMALKSRERSRETALEELTHKECEMKALEEELERVCRYEQQQATTWRQQYCWLVVLRRWLLCCVTCRSLEGPLHLFARGSSGSVDNPRVSPQQNGRHREERVGQLDKMAARRESASCGKQAATVRGVRGHLLA